MREPDAGAPLEAATFVAFLEGPATDAQGTVYFSDIRGNRIMTLTEDGVLGVFREDAGRANGNVFDQPGSPRHVRGS